MLMEDIDNIVLKIKKEINKAPNAIEASHWAKCIQSLVTANAIHFNVTERLQKSGSSNSIRPSGIKVD